MSVSTSRASCRRPTRTHAEMAALHTCVPGLGSPSCPAQASSSRPSIASICAVCPRACAGAHQHPPGRLSSPAVLSLPTHALHARARLVESIGAMPRTSADVPHRQQRAMEQLCSAKQACSGHCQKALFGQCPTLLRAAMVFAAQGSACSTDAAAKPAGACRSALRKATPAGALRRTALSGRARRRACRPPSCPAAPPPLRAPRRACATARSAAPRPAAARQLPRPARPPPQPPARCAQG